MSDSNTNNGVQIGFAGLLTIVFIVLKLTHVINWSWWWVLAPSWICLAFAGILLIVAGIIFIISGRMSS